MVIKEFLPNPVGSDKKGEYIKLFNDGGNIVSLSGWQIKDASGKTFNLSGDLSAGKELILPYSKTKIALNNNGEQVFLYDNAGKLVDKLDYIGQAEEGQIITRIMNNELGIMEIEYGQLNNNRNNWQQVIFIDFLTAAILAALGLYIILQLERKLNIKLF
jgi:hypothetical protein